MAKRKLRRGVQRRRLDEPYNVDYFARKHDISPEQTCELMRKIGRDCDKLNEAPQNFFAGWTAEDAILRQSLPLQSPANGDRENRQEGVLPKRWSDMSSKDSIISPSPTMSDLIRLKNLHR